MVSGRAAGAACALPPTQQIMQSATSAFNAALLTPDKTVMHTPAAVPPHGLDTTVYLSEYALCICRSRGCQTKNSTSHPDQPTGGIPAMRHSKAPSTGQC